MLILGIDTTEKEISIALSEDNKLLGKVEKVNSKTENLILLLDGLYNQVEKKVNETKLIGVITGPGGYTGTRSGVVVSKTLGQFLDIPVMGFDKLEVLIKSYDSKDFISPLINVKRNEAYTGIAKKVSHSVEYLIKPSLVKVGEWMESLQEFPGKLVLLTSEFKNNPIITETNSNIIVDDEFYLKPEFINNLALENYKMGIKTNYKDINPFYIREAV